MYSEADVCVYHRHVSAFLADPGLFCGAVHFRWGGFRFSIRAIHIVTLMIIPLGFQYVFVDGLTAMAKTKEALMLSVFRKCLYAAGCVVLPMLFTAEAAFYTEPLADIVSATVTTTVFLLVINKHLRMRQAVTV